MKIYHRFAAALVLATSGLGLTYSAMAADAPGAVKAPPFVIKTPATSTVSRSGTVKVVITLSVESAIGTDEAISCTASIASDDASFLNEASSSGSVVRSGSSGTLTLPIPYNWTMAATGETVTVSANCSEGASYESGVSHSIYFTGSAFVVPATAGTVTTVDLSASI
jgi:hypothetical protein